MTFTKTIAIWLVIATLLLVNGALGQMVFSPVVGLEAAEMMAAFIAIDVIFGVSRWLLAVERELPLLQVLGVAALSCRPWRARRSRGSAGRTRRSE